MKVLHTGDVIAFYNSVFVPAVKTDLLRINQDRASLARPPVTENLTGASPARSYNRQALFTSAAKLLQQTGCYCMSKDVRHNQSVSTRYASPV